MLYFTKSCRNFGRQIAPWRTGNKQSVLTYERKQSYKYISRQLHVYAEHETAGKYITNSQGAQFPYMVSISLRGRHQCGGTIISQDSILTAAHCVANQNPSGISVLTGTSTLSTGGQKIDVNQISIHPGFDRRTLEDDIAIIKLKHPMKLGRSIDKVLLSSGFSYTVSGTNVTAVGWGSYSSEKRTPSNHLQFLDLIVISNEECQKVAGKWNITSDHICTVPKVRGTGVCIGDSGGPVLMNNTQIGVISFVLSYDCGNTNRPETICVKVSSYVDWIRSQIIRS